MFRYMPTTTKFLALSLAASLSFACSEDDDSGSGGSGNGGSGNGSNDTGSNDTGSNDTGSNDTGGNDTGGNDTGGNDTDCGDALTQDSIDCSGDTCLVPGGEYVGEINFGEDKPYLLQGPVFVGAADDDTLPIEGCEGNLSIASSTTATEPRYVFADSTAVGNVPYIAVRPDSELNVTGTSTAPVIFTSAEKEDGQPRARGDWGGIILSGRAPSNCGSSCLGEGDTGLYGSEDSNADDSSGSLKYVIVAYAGNVVSGRNELNAVAFQGVGSGTEVDNIVTYNGADDGVEFFGGTVNAKRVFVYGAADDSIDWTYGWTGKLQYGVVIQDDADGNNGFESSNGSPDDGVANDAEPRSAPVISNVTVLGPQNNAFEVNKGSLGQFWAAAGGDFEDSVVTIADVGDGTAPVFAYNAHCGNVLYSDEDTQATVEDGTGNIVVGIDEDCANAFFGASVDRENFAGLDLVPDEGSPLIAEDGVVTSPADDDWFDETNYIGAADPAAETQWYDWALPILDTL